MEKITVKICMGTTCFVMGAANLQELMDIIPEKYGQNVEIQGVPCLDLCSNNSESHAPYVDINNEIITSATVEKVLNIIDGKLKNGQE